MLKIENTMEELLLNLGFSHTLSKVTPYLFAILFGIMFMRQVCKSSYLKNIIAKWIIAILVLLLPFAGYFSVNPIYEGDFSQNGKEIKIRNAKTTELKNGLLVLTIPGCPYCFESIPSLKQLKKRNPKLNITFVVTGADDKSVMKDYLKEVNGAFQVELMPNSIALVREAGEFFPAFVMVKNGTANYVWTNDQFGVRAKDRLENWK